MDSSQLAGRIRGVLGGAGRQAPDSGLPTSGARSPEPEALDLSALGGEWRDGCFLVERRFEPAVPYGRERVGDLSARLEQAAHRTALVGAPLAVPPFVFLDLETTGLSGGAGTQAFLVGLGAFTSDGAFLTRQFLLTRIADERRILGRVAEILSAAGALVTFNGRSFDAPVLETRYLYHRLEWVAGRLPHLDALHPARRFWGADSDACTLVSLERKILGARRVGDVPGFEIPARYFQFLRTRDAAPLAGVFEHNRLDLLSLAGVAARLLHLVDAGPSGVRHPREALALGRIYERAGLNERAHEALERSTALCGCADIEVRLESLRWRAILLRRERRFDDAAACWRAIVDTHGCPAARAREANEALAIHHEHRVRDLQAARSYALETLKSGGPAVHRAVAHRVARLDKKMRHPLLGAGEAVG